jgi:hypothetical protein
MNRGLSETAIGPHYNETLNAPRGAPVTVLNRALDIRNSCSSCISEWALTSVRNIRRDDQPTTRAGLVWKRVHAHTARVRASWQPPEGGAPTAVASSGR